MKVLHDRRLIHRDLKPDNVLLSESLEPKIGDFGLSKFVEPGQTMMQTMAGGTRPYIAPEIWRGEEYAFPVDVYAYGVLVYRVITCEVPWHGLNNIQVLKRVTGGERPSTLANVAATYRDLIASCWANAPITRPTFGYIVAVLENPTRIPAAVHLERFRAYQQSIGATPVGCDPARRTLPAPSIHDQIRDLAQRGDPLGMFRYGMRLLRGE
jgi:serine/threonine protein kinase